MSDDIRVRTSLRTNLKWIKLGARLGADAQLALLYLWLWTREHRPKGILHDVDPAEIEALVAWPGAEGAFVQALLELRWLRQDESGLLSIHQWDEHNPWACNAEHRSRVGRENARKGWAKRRGGSAQESRGSADGKQPASGPHANGKHAAVLPSSPPHSPPLPSSLKEGGRGTASAALPDGEGAAKPTCSACGASTFVVTPDDGRCMACTMRGTGPADALTAEDGGLSE